MAADAAPDAEVQNDALQSAHDEAGREAVHRDGAQLRVPRDAAPLERLFPLRLELFPLLRQ